MSSQVRPRPERIEVGGLLAGLGAILLLISLFLEWFEPGLSAWTVFEALDLVLAAAAAIALAFAARSFGFVSIGGTAATTAGAVALVVVVSQLVNQPPAVLDEDPQVGAWLALGGASLMLAGALMSRTGISLALDVERPGGYGRAAEARPGSAGDTRPGHPVANDPPSPPISREPAPPKPPLSEEPR